MILPILTLSEAVSQKVSPRRSIYLGNFGSQLFSVGHEIIRQKLTSLDVIVASGGMLLDQLFGANTVRSAVFGHCWSPVGPSPAWNFRRLAESGDRTVRMHELSLGMLTAALTAGAWKVPFMPFPIPEGTGYITDNWTGGLVSTVDSTFGKQKVIGALTPDVAFVHADKCDEFGNCYIAAPLGEALVASAAARETVIVTEELVSSEELVEEGVTLTGLGVSAVVVQSGAVWPDGAVGRYDRDIEAYAEYATVTSTPQGFESWLRSLDDIGGHDG